MIGEDGDPDNLEKKCEKEENLKNEEELYMRCNRRIVTNGAYRRFRRFVRWFKNSGSGARCVTNNRRKMSGQNTLRLVQLRVWRERKHN